MSNRRNTKSSRELEAELDALASQMAGLSVQLQEARLLERPSVPYAPPSTDQEQYKALVRKMVGRRVLITIKGKHAGKQGTITRHAGNTFKPVNWYILLPDGSEVMKHKHSFRLLPRADATAAASEEEEEES
jgi:hypothetical protein